VEGSFILQTVICVRIHLVAQLCLMCSVMYQRSLYSGIRTVLLESEDHECPDCKEKDVSPDTLIPNRFLRNNVNNFKNETGYNKSTVRQPRRLLHPLTHGQPLQVIGAPPPMQQIPSEPSGPMHEFTDASAGLRIYRSLLVLYAVYTVLLVEYVTCIFFCVRARCTAWQSRITFFMKLLFHCVSISVYCWRYVWLCDTVLSITETS
jgi:hypothetical protein